MADGGAVRNPARDSVSGELVTVLRSPAPADPLSRFRELDRLRRYAAVRHPALAEVLAVELRGGEVHLVCRPLTGAVLGGEPLPHLTVSSVRTVAGGLLDAVAALQLTGVRHWVHPERVLVRGGCESPADATVTLLPLALTAPPSPVGEGVADDDRHRAATQLLSLLRRVHPSGPEDESRAHELSRALEGAGGVPEESWGPPGSGLFAPATTPHLGPPPAPLHLSPLALAPCPAEPAPVAAPPVRGRRSGRASVIGAATLAAVVTVIAVLSLLARDGNGTHAASAAGRPPGTATSARPSRSSWDLPTTVPALIDKLADRPDAGGASGPALLDTLRGLTSGDAGTVRESAVHLVSQVLDDPGVDPRAGAAGLAALVTSPLGGGPDASPSCFGVVASAPDPQVQGYARHVLDRLPAWQTAGLPAGKADQVRGLAALIAAGRAAPVLAPCPTG